MECLENYRDRLKNILSPKRYHHSICVEKQAVFLAPVLGADPEKASVAGLLHDITKEWDYNEQLQYINSHDILIDVQTMQNSAVWHAITASVFLEKECSITDPDILGAVRWHTTGRKKMTALEKTIFIADFTSEDRNYPDYESVKALIPDNIAKAIVEGFVFGLSGAIKNKTGLIPDSVSGYNYYLSKLIEGERA